MENKDIAKHLAIAIQAAESGVDYFPTTGARCPFCGRRKVPVYTTRPWEHGCRIRYHKCGNPGCYLNQLNKTIKSVESLEVRT
jgi:hypothetical protein